MRDKKEKLASAISLLADGATILQALTVFDKLTPSERACLFSLLDNISFLKERYGKLIDAENKSIQTPT